MLCFRCGSHVQDGAEKCWNCGTQLATSKKKGASTTELRAKQRTNTRVFGVVFKVGDLIANRYRVKDIVGSGGAGVVYRAHDQEIDVDVAVKVINAKLVQTADEQRLFSRQTKIARKLSHQNVVRIYDEGRDEQRPFFTMQFLEGLSLRKIIDLRKEKKQTFALTEVEPIFNQLCQALEYAHKTTFHGNLKPDNVIVLPDLLKVTDFSLLRGLPRKPFLAIQKSRGTNFRYLAPEVRLEVPDLDKSVDVYSVGVVLAEMLTGLVFDDAKPEQLSIAATGLDATVINVIKRCVARAPKDRYPSTADVYDEIRKALTKGAGKRPLESGEHPATAAEAPTQRLDIAKHGERPVAEPLARPAPPAIPVPPAPVAVAAAVSLGEGHAPSEGSGIFDAIEDDMIESAAPAGVKSEVKAPEAPSFAEPQKSGNGVHPNPPDAPAGAGFGAISPAADLVDDPRAAPAVDETEDETQAILDREPLPIPSSIEGLEEISNSSIELIDDPRATNRYQLGAPVGPTPIVTTPPDGRATEVPEVRTAQPAPLPDSAIPAPAFAQAVAAETTRHGRLDGGPEPLPRAQSKRPQTRSSLPAVTKGLTLDGAIGPAAPAPAPPPPPAPMPERSIPRSPTLAMDPASGPIPKSSPKQRPMTRPRMPTMAAAPRPSTSTLPSPAPLADPADVLARPLTLEMPKATGAVAPPPNNNRALYFTVGAFALVVILALFVVLKVSSDQASASKEQIALLQAQLNSMAQNARQSEKVASADFEKEKAAAEEAKRSSEAAAAKAKAAEAEKAKAEAEAKAREDEAQRQAEAAQKSADQAVRAEAEKKAAALNKEAEEKRKAAAEAAKKEREEQRRLAEEQKKADEAEKKRARAEAKMLAEREAAERAEERAKKAQDQKEAAAMERLAKEAEAEKKRADSEAKRAEAEAKKAEEEARKKEAAERAAAEKLAAAEKPTETTAAAATAAGAEKADDDDGEGGALAAGAAAGGGTCKNGMVLVPAGTFMMGSPQSDPERNFGDKSYESVNVKAFCVDYYEFPNGRGRDPTVRVNQKTADQRCKKAGKRLCTEEEWEKACKGPSGSRYPYANQWDPAACNTEDDEGNDRQVAKSGSFRKCRSGYNVFDLSGNVGEWTDSGSGGSYVVKGGSADRPGYDGRCAARKTKKAAEATDLLGFRCCADPG